MGFARGGWAVVGDLVGREVALRLRYRVGVAAAVVVVVSVSAVVAQSGRFADVPPDHSAFEAVEWAAGVGLTHGKADGTFGVDDPLSKRHAVIFMERFYDTVLKADQSGDFTRGDMMVLLKEISDGTAEPGSVSVSPGVGSSETDRAALVALFNATDGPNWSKKKQELAYRRAAFSLGRGFHRPQRPGGRSVPRGVQFVGFDSV